MRIITKEAFRPYFRWIDAVEAIRAGHRLDKAEVADTFLGPHDATLLNRSAFIAGMGYGVKAVTVLDENPKRNLPTVQGGMFYFDADTGCLKSLLETRLITDIKTAADSVCGASYLARKDSHVLLIVGAGNMAGNMAQAYTALFPQLTNILIWSRRPEQAASLVESLGELGPDVTAVEDLPAACGRADIISTVTMAREPVLCGKWVKPGTHIDLIGAYKADMREADDTLMGKASLFVDSRETTLHHIGELIKPLQDDIITETSVLGDLYELVSGQVARNADDEITVFKNGGGAHLDTMIAHYITEAFPAEGEAEAGTIGTRSR